MFDRIHKVFGEKIYVRIKRGRQWTKRQRMAAGCVDQPINAQGITDSGFHHKPGVIDQVVSADDIWFYHCVCEGCGQAAAVGGLIWHD